MSADDQSQLFGDCGRPKETPAPPASGQRPWPKAFDARQLRAIRHYCKSNNLRPGLSTFPTVYMTNKTTGEEVRLDIKDVLDVYDEDRKEAARERARTRRTEKPA